MFEYAMEAAFRVIEMQSMEGGPSPLQMVEVSPHQPPRPQGPPVVASTPMENVNERHNDDHSKDFQNSRRSSTHQQNTKNEERATSRKKTRTEKQQPQPEPHNSLVPKVLGTPIQRNDEWEILWDKLRYSGWTCKMGSGLMTDYYYIKPDKDVKTGSAGTDYFTSKEDVMEFAATFYNWSGSARNSQVRDSSAAVTATKDNTRRRSRGKTNSDSKASSKTKSKQRVSKSGSPHDRIWGKPPTKKEKGKRKRSSTGTDTSTKRRNSKGKGSVSIIAATPTDCRTKPKDPAIPLSESSLSSSSSFESQSKNDTSSGRNLCEKWNKLWPRLSKAGWKCVKAPLKNLQHEYYWVRPGRDARAEDSQLGVDYFASQQDVLDYQKREDEADDAAKENRKRKRCDSVVLDDFEKEAMATKVDDGLSAPSASADTSEPLACGWWTHNPIPQFMDIWHIFMKKMGFWYSKRYYTPDGKSITEGGVANVDYFGSPEDMRKYLCRVGIPNLHKVEDDEEAYNLITRWVSTAFLPPKTRDVDNVPLLTSRDAWKILQSKLGCEKDSGKYNVPIRDKGRRRASYSIRKFDTIEDIRAYLRRHGLDCIAGTIDFSRMKTPKKRNADDAITREEIVAISFWASLSPLPVYKTKKTKENETEQRPLTMVTVEKKYHGSKSKNETYTPLDGQFMMSSLPVVTAQGKSRSQNGSSSSPSGCPVSSEKHSKVSAVQAAFNAESETPTAPELR